MSQKLYVGNLSFTSTEESITNLFSQYGEVQSVKIPTDHMTGRPRGFCFVEMENAEEAKEKLNNVEFEGRTLKVDIAQERPQGGGDRGGFGGGGNRGGRQGGGGFNRNRSSGNNNRNSW
jgi:RNA recognition motif-containing protein